MSGRIANRRNGARGCFPPKRQAGTTLIEVLVTLVVLSIGLLGVAAMQMLSLQSNQNAYFRSQATALTAEITDHARANRSIVLGSSSLPNEDFWNQRAAELLPSGQVSANVNGDPGEITIDVSWLDNRGNEAPNDGMVTYRVRSRI